MSSLKNSINYSHSFPTLDARDTLHLNSYHAYPPRSRTPNGLSTPVNPAHLAGTGESEPGADDDPKMSIFKELYMRSEARLESLFGEDGGIIGVKSTAPEQTVEQDRRGEEVHHPAGIPHKKAARAIDEDNYDESDEDEEDSSLTASPLKPKSAATSIIPTLSSPALLRGTPVSSAPGSVKGAPSQGGAKSSEDVRKRLQEDKKALEDAAKRSFHTMFHTLENDRDAMLDQKKLDESERQVDVEMNGHSGATGSAHPVPGATQQGTLSQTNLGASSLTLKHLIARIDAKRDQVRASDAELRTLMSEVRKNRSKWASSEKIGQEELYEAAEKVLSELKAMTEHSTAFLTRVNKREAPDYYNGIRH